MQQKGSLKIPPALKEAHLLNKTGWTWAELRTTPQHLIDQLLLLWHLQALADKTEATKRT